MSEFIAYHELRNGTLTMRGSVVNLKENGFVPQSIIDVGAYHGEWTRMVHAVYPEARILMVEGNPQKEGILAAVKNQLDNRVDYVISLLGGESRESIPFYEMETGSSVRPEQTSVPRRIVNLPMRTLDHVVQRANITGPFFLKMDVQGYELEVLRGAPKVLRETAVILLEVLLMEYNKGAPLFAEVIQHMDSEGFAMYDFCGQARRKSDAVLFSTDLIFVRKDSKLLLAKPF